MNTSNMMKMLDELRKERNELKEEVEFLKQRNSQLQLKQVMPPDKLIEIREAEIEVLRQQSSNWQSKYEEVRRHNYFMKKRLAELEAKT